ncbi:thiol-disulfide oxidoreductase ResA [Sporosarcina aquimarina]|uniref:thiol-disulfide oxidoreductase ResA n=1 Tax=Sporosarcina aquimarina TaxID=114975 RepID=UPI0020406739|nr:thiol-disulfide oxidoreductase ResA [Sporosarcina aquimarina]MCM3756834.1 thiol-disulfide oxidoreductase ResA [Sporosarcina aquimarina]
MDKKKKRLFIRGAILLVLAAAIVFALTSKKETKVLAVGDKAPNFELQDMNGKKVKLSDYEGQGVFLNFWGTWCPPCKKEMPYIEKHSKEFTNKGVQVLSVNIGESEFKVNTFINQYGLTFPVLIDKNKSVSRNSYNVVPLPTTMLIDKNGVIKQIVTREMSEAEIVSLMESIQPE